MQVIFAPVAALAVASIYYAYRAYLEASTRKKRALHERVSYMLWSAAHQLD